MFESEDREAPMVAVTAAVLLDLHPAAALCAIGPDGMSVGMPDSVATSGHRLVAARSPLDLVAPEDRLAVISIDDGLECGLSLDINMLLSFGCLLPTAAYRAGP